MVLLAVLHEAIQAIAENLHPLNQHHVHDSDGISNHLHVYIFCYSLVQDIPKELVK